MKKYIAEHGRGEHERIWEYAFLIIIKNFNKKPNFPSNVTSSQTARFSSLWGLDKKLEIALVNWTFAI